MMHNNFNPFGDLPEMPTPQPDNLTDEVSWMKVDPQAAAAASGEEDITEGGDNQGGGNNNNPPSGELEG